MSKLVPSLSGIACLLWVVLWSWGLTRENNLRDSTADACHLPGIRIAEADTVFEAVASFSFPLSDFHPSVPDEALSFLQQLAHFLKNHPEKSMILTGSYLPLAFERNRSPYPDLGIARADAIKKIIVLEGGDPDQLEVASREVQQLLVSADQLIGGVEFEFTREQDLEEITAEAANRTGHEKPKKVSAEPDGAPAVVFNYDYQDFSLAKNSRADLDELRELVRKNPSFRLIITGFSSSDEEAKVTGLAERRSLAVRRYLVDTGVRRRNIIVESRPGAAQKEVDRRVEITIVK